MFAEWIAFVSTAILAVALVARAARAGGRSRGITWALSAVALVVVIACAAVLDTRRRAVASARGAFAAEVPRQGRPGGYVGSGACQSCHPREHGTWHDSYHRRMTQYATPQTVLGRFDGAPMPLKGGEVRMVRRKDEYWAVARQDGKAIEHRIGLLTGSHHMQVYWMAAPDRGNRQEMAPYVFLIEDQRWVPARDTFLSDPEQPWAFEKWNDQCVQCHTTGGQPRPVDSAGAAWDTRVGELGIACEACHGPGEAHIAANGDPLRRYTRRLAGSDPTIVNPRRLDHRRSSEVCGHCHGITVFDRDAWKKEGHKFRPGAALDEVQPVVHADGRGRAGAFLAAALAVEKDYVHDRFWSDGMVRVSGREWNGVSRSPCHVRGQLSCGSCHTMHGYTSPDDQLAPGKQGNDACLSCHEGLRANVAAHTRHAPASSGSECMNCHMPHTTYGLLKAIRSHEIDSPSVATTLATGRPNACNACHLDRSLGWTAEYLTRWFGAAPVALSEDERTLAAGVLWLVAGDAGQRALAAWHMGWGPARDASGAEWMPAFLSIALGDPYAAVRYIASRSLRRSPEWRDVQYDYVARPEVLEARVAEIAGQVARGRQPVDPQKAERVLLRFDGSLQRAPVEALFLRRDQRPYDLKE